MRPSGTTGTRGVVTTEPTCTEAGVKTFTCKHDASHTRTETVAAVGHSAGEPARENESAATCERIGSYDLVARCAKCGEVVSSEAVAVPAHGHDWNAGVVTKEPTCMEGGERTFTCSHDASHMRAEEVAALGHSYVEIVVDATTEAGGYTLHECSRCGDSYKTDYTDKLTSAAPATSTVTAKVSIAKATVAGIGSKTYTGKSLAPAPVVKLAGKTLSAKTDYRVSYRNAKGEAVAAASVMAVGSYQVAIAGKGSYTGQVTKAFTIVKAKAKKFTVAKVKARKYTGKAVKPVPTVKFAGKKLKKGTDYTLSYKHNKKPGIATITVKGKGNFTGKKTVKFSIAKSSVKLKAVAARL